MRAPRQRLTYDPNPPGVDAYVDGRLVGKIVPRCNVFQLTVGGAHWGKYKTLARAKAAMRRARDRCDLAPHVRSGR